MSFIIMAKSFEDHSEFRATNEEYVSREEAEIFLPEAQENYDCARVWIEEFRNKDFYMALHQERFDEDGYEDLDDYDLH